MRKATILAFTLLGGCAASSSYQGVPEKVAKVENTAILDAPFEEVWDRLIKNLSKEFFVINNVEKASRIINVSFSSNQPSELIDCGRATRSFKSAAGKEENYSYLRADDTFYKSAETGGQYVLHVNRDTNLDGRANIYVAPKGEGTEISVNARFVFSVQLTIVPFNAFDNAQVGAPNTEPPYTNQFDSQNPGNWTDRGVTWGCASTGSLEQRIIAAAKGL